MSNHYIINDRYYAIRQANQIHEVYTIHDSWGKSTNSMIGTVSHVPGGSLWYWFYGTIIGESSCREDAFDAIADASYD